MEAKSISIKPQSPKILWYAIPVLLLILTAIYLILNSKTAFSLDSALAAVNNDFFFYTLVGLAAQLVDGTLGMAYGITSTSSLLALGVPPAVSSASVHVAEMFTTGASAISHYRFGNINKKLLKSLVIPGVLGAVAGAYLLSDFINGDFIKPYISGYMIILGIVIIRKALQKNIVKKKTKNINILAAFGGFIDSIGGGGWGPVVTSTLLGQGRDPRYTIGSVNASEFAVSFASGITFIIFQGISNWQVVAGLIIGGVIASPFGAFLVNKVRRRPLMILVGVVVILLSLRTILKGFHLI
ncbi:sulfite exporter TauE/SafE family protein [Emticicia sp. SJ17W-69]|uniref:sulfite exporter TauE/SafE family protein n=1 Tax=Emticicia sp. SJ17W-69 TaxID=3421657 RepID=UPI003EBC8742